MPQHMDAEGGMVPAARPGARMRALGKLSPICFSLLLYMYNFMRAPWQTRR